MINVIYKKIDMRYVFFTSDNPIELENLEKYLNKIPQYMFLPSFAGVPKPTCFLNKFRAKDGRIIYWCHSGLWKCVYDWCAANNIIIQGIDNFFKYTDFNLSLDDFRQYIIKWDLNLDPYDYQVDAAWLILKYRQSLSELATRSGKTLIAYIVFRYMLENGAKKILMIVPSIHLVKQGVKDFQEYKEFFQTETVWAKGEMCSCANLTIGTYQSLVLRASKKSKKYNPKFFNDYDVVCVDESHHLVAKSLDTILGLDFMKRLKLRFGFTGTLPKEHSIESFTCQSLMGPKIQDITTRELVDQGFLANPIITQIRLKYEDNEDLIDQYIKCGEYLNSSYVEEDGKKISLPKEEREFTIQHVKTLPIVLKKLKPTYTKLEYRDYLVDLCKAKGSNLLMLEQMLVHRSTRRIQIIKNIIDKHLTGNCIIFAHHTEYLRYLKNTFKQMYPNRPIYIIIGTETIKKRMKIIDAMLTDKDAILFASYGCCSTGITFKNIDYGIFAQSFKSEIVVLQSIGRGLLKTETKDTFPIYDIIDVFPTGKLLAQGKSKISTYKEREFEHRIIETV